MRKILGPRFRTLTLVFVAFFATSELAAAQNTRRLTWASLERMRWPDAQESFDGYERPVQRAMWRDIYANGGTELYCRKRFQNNGENAPRIEDRPLSLEHAFPAGPVAQFFGFTDRTCDTERVRHTNQAYCHAATGDMHNLWPAYGMLNSSHGDSQYGELEGEGTTNPAYEDICSDWERGVGDEPDLVEPTRRAAGDLARSILYMHYVYCLPFEIAIADETLLLQWANADPVDASERRRERQIRTHQPNSWNPIVLPAPRGQGQTTRCVDD